MFTLSAAHSMPEPSPDPAPGSGSRDDLDTLATHTPGGARQSENEAPARGQPLKLVTSFPDTPSSRYPSVSLLPTPMVPPSQGAGGPAAPHQALLQSPPLSGQRVFSSSLVPDGLPALSTPVSAASPQLAAAPAAGLHEPPEKTARPIVAVPQGGAGLGRNGSLVIPKRGDRVAQLARSGSVGSPQRQPTTVLHRERKVSSIPGPESVPEQVYVASSSTVSSKMTAWKRVKYLGKGSFSQIVLAWPAGDYVRPDIRDAVEAEAETELARIEKRAGPEILGSPKLLVAVKITPIADKDDPQLHAYKRDVELVSMLPSHPSLLRMIGSSLDMEVHHRSLFVLPYCPGGDLFDLVADHRSALSALLVRRLFADVCSAVAFLHAHLVVHRDIKLENVLLEWPVDKILTLDRPDQLRAPLAKLTDLGLARRISAEQPLLTTRCGSDDYVPPELLLGQPYDGRETDSWALGVLLYAILEGRLPFDTPPNAMSEGVRARLRTAHRIARVDWNWYKRRECPPEWQGGKDVVDNTLVRRKQRRTAAELLAMPWVAGALPDTVESPYDFNDTVELFMQ